MSVFIVAAPVGYSWGISWSGQLELAKFGMRGPVGLAVRRLRFTTGWSANQVT